MASMTRRVTVSLPDDIAGRLDRESNASAYVAEALRARMSHERTMELLAESGYSDLPESAVEEASARIKSALARKHDPATASRAAATLDSLHGDR